jgi:peptidylprolyl isomerase
MNAKIGDKVKVHYKGILADGTEFDSSKGKDPLEFEIGAGMMIKGFDNAVNGMGVGEKIAVNIVAEEAYGQHNDELIYKIPMKQIPDSLDPKVGQTLSMQHPDGQSIPVQVLELTDEFVGIDANHQLAGKDLIFEIELVEIA